ncbi:unnamed protein product [Caenorhabditis auriculariae]|uniref:Uncharacterized protein n=1 Tax=Caenorhabditis auriculariae TaxID=2777116 RepID=A0A8S1HK29_9PELO|nr:unnamed protein product [Caenorhabditis auriculariae]
MDARMQAPQELWVFDEILVHREGQDAEMFFDAPRVQERVVDRALDEHQRRIRFYLDTLKARTQHGAPLRAMDAGVGTDESWAEEEAKKEKLERELKERNEEMKEEKEKLMKANAANGRLTAHLAQTSLELGSTLAREELLRQEVLLLRARLAEADEERVRLAALLQAAVQAIDIPVEPELAADVQQQEDEVEHLLRPDMDQASPRKRRRSSSSCSDGSSVKRSRSGAESPDVFRTPERGVEHARNGQDATSGEEEEEGEREPQLEEEDEVVPESDQEELAESSSSGPPSPAPSSPPRSLPPATPPRTPTPPVQPTRRQRRAQAVMGVLKRSSRIGNTLPGPQPKPPVDAQPIPLAVLAPLTAAEVGATIQTRLADYDSGVYIQNLAVVVKLGRYLTTARRLSRNLPSSIKDLQDLESLKESLSRQF